MKQTVQHGALTGELLPGAPTARSGDGGAGPADRLGWPPGGLRDGVAVERIEQRGQRRGVGPLRVPDHAEAEERGHHHQPDLLTLGHEVLDRRQHAVARPALAGRRPGVGQARADRRSGCRERCRPLRPPSGAGPAPGSCQGRSSHRAGRGASTRRGTGAAAAPIPGARAADQRQLLADRVVVVIAVDHDRVGQGQVGERVEARLTDQLEVGLLGRPAPPARVGAPDRRRSPGRRRGPPRPPGSGSDHRRTPPPPAPTWPAPRPGRAGGSRSSAPSTRPSRSGSCRYGSKSGSSSLTRGVCPVSGRLACGRPVLRDRPSW